MSNTNTVDDWYTGEFEPRIKPKAGRKHYTVVGQCTDDFQPPLETADRPADAVDQDQGNEQSA